MDAEQLAERISIRLQHANSAVVLTTIKVLLYLMNYMEDESLVRSLERKMGPPLGKPAINKIRCDTLTKVPLLSHSSLVRTRGAIRRPS
jgi:vesicle coat complex subunit